MISHEPWYRCAGEADLTRLVETLKRDPNDYDTWQRLLSEVQRTQDWSRLVPVLKQAPVDILKSLIPQIPKSSIEALGAAGGLNLTWIIGGKTNKDPLIAARNPTGSSVVRVAIVGRQSLTVWSYDAVEVFKAFARDRARSVLHLWDPPAPEVVGRWLETGDPTLADAAYAAAARAAAAAAWSAGAAARAAAAAAARAAAWSARAGAVGAAASGAWAAYHAARAGGPTEAESSKVLAQALVGGASAP